MIKKIVSAIVICFGIGLWYFGVDLHSFFNEAFAPPK
ncbi:hypothetical protein EC836_101558 [Erwinia sp. JUb26]|nr:hypothetical protein EC836_101558 [Erwinia sp. JUb26]